jgi:hypothetical protein
MRTGKVQWTLIGGVLLIALTGSAVAQSAAPAAPVDPKLAARLAAESEARKQCKVEICKVFAERKADGGPISCSVTKTWLEGDIQQRILGDRLSWPWGHAQCSAKIDLDRAAIAKLVSDPEATVKLKKHDVSCSLDRKGNEQGEAYAVKLAITPEVTFKNGRATKVTMGWSDIDAPILAKGAIWSATAADNAFNVMSGSVVGEINSFIYEHCKEVGVDVAQPK